MTTAEQPEQPKNLTEPKGKPVDALIGAQIVHILGRPADLHKVQIRRLWENYYRVNILVGSDAACAKVAHSYFLKVDGDGNIIESTPKVQRQQPRKPHPIDQ
jgi:hypothetical protein